MDLRLFYHVRCLQTCPRSCLGLCHWRCRYDRRGRPSLTLDPDTQNRDSLLKNPFASRTEDRNQNPSRFSIAARTLHFQLYRTLCKCYATCGKVRKKQVMIEPNATAWGPRGRFRTPVAFRGTTIYWKFAIIVVPPFAMEVKDAHFS